MSVYLGIDIGTSGVKTLAINPRGDILAEASSGYQVYFPKPMWTEQNPEDWWQAVIKTVRAVLRKGKIQAGSVKSIGLSGQMHGSVFLDKRGEVVRPALLWNDQRTTSECGRQTTCRVGGRRSQPIGEPPNA